MSKEEYEKLYLGKKEMLIVVENALNNMKKSNISSKKLVFGVLAVKGLIKLTDEGTLNIIWNEIIKFTDELRHKNALNDPSLPKLSTLKEIQAIKDTIEQKESRLP